MTLVVVTFVAAVAVGASALWWIHKDGLAAEAAAGAPAAAVEIAQPRAAAAAPALAAAVPAQRTNNEVRAWGRAHGHAVSDRGPLPKVLVAAFAAAHADA